MGNKSFTELSQPEFVRNNVAMARSPIVINGDIICSPYNDNHIWKFNNDHHIGKWTKHELGNYKSMNNHSMCVSNDGEKIFLYDGCINKILLIIDIKTMKVIKKIMILATNHQSIICDPYNEDLLHVISSNQHFILNIETEAINLVYTFEPGCGYGSGVVFNEYKKEFLLFRGNIPIYSYDLISKKWTNTNIEMPKKRKVYNFGYVTTKDKKYVLIIGGTNCDGGKNCNTILIYDIMNSKYEKCPIKTPKLKKKDVQEYHAYMTNAVLSNDGNIHLFQYNRHYTININQLNIDTDNKSNEFETKTDQFETEQLQQNSKQNNTAKKSLQNQNKGQMLTDDDNEMEVKRQSQKLSNDNMDKSKKILHEWDLSQYINILIIDQGYDDIQDWMDLSLNELTQMGFKPGHSKRFKRRINEYFKQKQKPCIEGDDKTVQYV